MIDEEEHTSGIPLREHLVHESSLNPKQIARFFEKQQNIRITVRDNKGNVENLDISHRQLLHYIYKFNHSRHREKDGVKVENRSRSNTRTFMCESVQLRDLRRIDYNYNFSDEPFIFVRNHAVLFSFTPVRAIVMADRVILIQHSNEAIAARVSEVLGTYLKGFTKKVHHHRGSRNNLLSEARGDNNSPHNDGFENEEEIAFEIAAYEALLSSIVSVQKFNFETYEGSAVDILDHCKHRVILSVDLQQSMLLVKNKVNSQLNLLYSMKKVLTDLLEEEDMMGSMNLTDLEHASNGVLEDVGVLHDNIEILLELYVMDFCAVETKLEDMQNQIKAAEESVILRLDTSRNQLLVVSTIISVLSLMMAFGGFVGAIFGMNLYSRMEDGAYQFYLITCLLIVFMVCGSYFTVYYLRREGILPDDGNLKEKRMKNFNQNYDVISSVPDHSRASSTFNPMQRA